MKIDEFNKLRKEVSFMNTSFSIVNLFTALISGFIGYLIGGINGLVIAFFIFSITDFITGIIKAIIHKSLNSHKGFTGLLKILLKWILVIVANTVDHYIIGSGELIRTAVLLVLIANEGISITENLSACGIPIPQSLLDYFERLKNGKGD